jgi:hypothetical protein
MRLILVVCGFVEILGLQLFILLLMTYFVVYASPFYRHELARECWSFMSMSGHVSASPSWA